VNAVRDPTPTLQWIRAIEAEVQQRGELKKGAKREGQERGWCLGVGATLKSRQVRLANFRAAAAQANKSQNQCQ